MNKLFLIAIASFILFTSCEEKATKYERTTENFGSDWSIICTANYVPADKVGITRERL